MSYKIGLILSTVFVAIFFLFGADLIALQSAFSALDAKASNISYLISRNGVIDDSFIHYVENNYHVTFTCNKNLAPTFGETITYVISSPYQPLILAKNPITISVKRMTVVGFYG